MPRSSRSENLRPHAGHLELEQLPGREGQGRARLHFPPLEVEQQTTAGFGEHPRRDVLANGERQRRGGARGLGGDAQQRPVDTWDLHGRSPSLSCGRLRTAALAPEEPGEEYSMDEHVPPHYRRAAHMLADRAAAELRGRQRLPARPTPHKPDATIAGARGVRLQSPPAFAPACRRPLMSKSSPARRVTRSLLLMGALAVAAQGPTLGAQPSPRGSAAASSAPLPAEALGALAWRNIGPNRGGRSLAMRRQSVAALRGTTSARSAAGCGRPPMAALTWKPVTDGQIRSSSVGAIAVAESEPRHRLHRDGGGGAARQHHAGRRRLQVHRRGQDVDATWAWPTPR